jgi:hypothetical protein
MANEIKAGGSLMNRERRREMRARAATRVRTAKFFVLLTFDGNGEPVYSYDVEGCGNRDDIRHVIMRTVANQVERSCTILRQVVEKKLAESEQSARVADALVKRSRDLAGEAAEDEPINGSEVPKEVPAVLVTEEEKAE